MSKKIWVVGIADCEGNSVTAVCSTKDIGVKEVFKAKACLIKQWEEAQAHLPLSLKDDPMYKDMIKNLSGNDYDNWNNYPHECPYIYETILIEEDDVY